MRRLLVLALVLVSLPAGAVDIEWVYVGEPGNPPGTAQVCAFPNFDCGSVPYPYYISKYEVTNAQYVEFLNAVAATDTHFLYSDSMSIESNGGIIRSGSQGSYVYALKSGQEDNPVVFVSWYDAARFANWLHNGQGNGDTETGAYTITADGIIDNTITRNVDATVFLPTENEWYKAAYYDEATTSYFDYPTGSNANVVSEPPPGGSNSANCRDEVLGYALTGSTNFDSALNYLSDVGAYAGSPSPYGTFDQGGNVDEWNEQRVIGYIVDGRGHRGGSWNSIVNQVAASYVGFVISPGTEDMFLGFRLARPVPEPTRGLLVLTGGLVLVVVGRWRGVHRRHADF